MRLERAQPNVAFPFSQLNLRLPWQASNTVLFVANEKSKLFVTLTTVQRYASHPTFEHGVLSVKFSLINHSFCQILTTHSSQGQTE
jgi:hypothetical protein